MLPCIKEVCCGQSFFTLHNFILAKIEAKKEGPPVERGLPKGGRTVRIERTVAGPYQAKL